jgi:hypothetical protein
VGRTDVGRTDVGRADDGTTTAAGARWTQERNAAMAAARRLDDAYRQYLGERGAKRMSLPVISRLVTGNARMRLTAVTLEGLPDLARPGAPAPPPEIAVARAGVSSECAAVRSWFDRFTASLGTGSPAVPPIPPVDDRLAPGLADAWTAARSKGRREDVVAVLRLLWVEERMADLRRLQVDLAGTVTGEGR